MPADGKPVDFVHVFGPMACILGVGNMFGEEMIKHDKPKKQTTTIITREVPRACCEICPNSTILLESQ